MGTNDANPSCPECGEPIGTHASYCMHCGAEFGDEGGEGAEDDGIGGAFGSVVDAIDGTSDQSPDVDYEPTDVEYDPADVEEEATPDPYDGREDQTVGAETSPETAGSDGSSGWAEATDAASSAVDAATGDGTTDGAGASGASSGAASGGGTDGAAAGEDRLLDPDSFLDNSLTVLVGVAAGVVVGFISLIAFVVAIGGGGVLLAFVVWAVSTAYLARRRTVFDAVRDAAYALAIVFVLAGLGAGFASGDSATEGLVNAAVAAIPFGFFALLVAGFGYAVGTKGVE